MQYNNRYFDEKFKICFKKLAQSTQILFFISNYLKVYTLSGNVNISSPSSPK